MAAIKHIDGQEVYVAEEVGGLTAEQIARQDLVDNAIYLLVRELNMRDSRIVNPRIPWDIEFIAWIRAEVFRYISTYNHDHTEMEFYPYIKEDDDENSGAKADEM